MRAYQEQTLRAPPKAARASASPGCTTHPLIRLQRTCGNAVTVRIVAVQRQLDPGALVGTAWLNLPAPLKARMVDNAIDAASASVDRFPGQYLLGEMWVFVKEGLLGFYGALKGAAVAVKIRAIDKIARIMTGQSLDYMRGLALGVLKGFFLDGLLGIFIAIWELIQGLSSLWDFIRQVERMVENFPDEVRELVQGFVDLGNQIREQIRPAMEEVRRLITDPGQAGGLITKIVEAGRSFAHQAGSKIATSLLEFFSRPGAEAEIGETAGRFVGMALFEVVFAVLTAGGGAAVTAAKSAARYLARLGGRILGSVLRVFRELGEIFQFVIRVVRTALRFVRERVLGAIARKFAGLLEKVRGFFRFMLRSCHESTLVCPLLKKIAEFHPNVLKRAGMLRREAREIFFRAYPRLRGRLIQIHHRIPLEYRRLFPRADPNRLSNLQALATVEHRRKASDLWDAFRNTYRRLRRAPTQREVVEFAGVVDRSLNLPYPL